MAYRLRDNLHYCICGGRVVFLDVNADRYFCLPGPAEIAFREFVTEAPNALFSEETLRPLLSRGLLVSDVTQSGLQPIVCMPRPTRDLAVSGDRRPPLKTSVLVIFTQLRIATLLRRGRLADIKRTVEQKVCRPQGTSHADTSSLLNRVAMAFAVADRFLPSADRCLVRSLAFHAICRRNGVSPTLVIGVRTNPFTAHCWVQRYDCVLTGDFEQARLFTPIMVIQ